MEKLRTSVKTVLAVAILLQAAVLLCGCYTVAGATAGAAYGAVKDTKTTYNLIIEADNWFRTHAW